MSELKKGSGESYEQVHKQLVEAMQDACINDAARERREPELNLSFLNEETGSNEPKKRRRLKYGAVAAAIVLLLAGVNVLLFSSGGANTYSDQRLFHRLYDEFGVKFSDWDTLIEITASEDPSSVKEFFPMLHIPEYLPEGYELEKMVASHYPSGVEICKYQYKDSHKRILEITCFYSVNSNLMDLVPEKGEVVKLPDRTLYLTWDDTANGYVMTVYTETGIIDVVMLDFQEKEVLIEIGKGLTQ